MLGNYSLTTRGLKIDPLQEAGTCGVHTYIMIHAYQKHATLHTIHSTHMYETLLIHTVQKSHYITGTHKQTCIVKALSSLHLSNLTAHLPSTYTITHHTRAKLHIMQCEDPVRLKS